MGTDLDTLRHVKLVVQLLKCSDVPHVWDAARINTNTYNAQIQRQYKYKHKHNTNTKTIQIQTQTQYKYNSNDHRLGYPPTTPA